MTEAQLQELLIGTYKPEEGGFVGGYCQLRGWLVDHTEKVTMKGYGGRTITKTPGAKGKPDLTLARRGRIVFLELKAERGRLTDLQVDWLNALTGQKEPIEHWRSRDEIPDGYAFHPVGGWTGVWAAGDWQILVAVVRPRHKEWVLETLR